MHRLRSAYEGILSRHKLILTTEKDAMRIDKPGLIEVIGDLPVYYMPIEISFHDKDGEEFNIQMIDFIRAKFIVKTQ